MYSQDEAQVHFTWENTTISPRSVGAHCKFTVEMKARRILHEKTQRFLRGRWRTEEGVYITKEQRLNLNPNYGLELGLNQTSSTMG